jgi:hypothetical protein
MKDMPLSIYECDTEEDVQVVALALSADRDEDRKFHFVHLTEADLGPCFAAIGKTEGATQTRRANEMHREFTVSRDELQAFVLRVAARARAENRRVSDAITGKELRRLARALNEWLSLRLPDCWLLH